VLGSPWLCFTLAFNQLTVSGVVCAARVIGATGNAVAESGYSTIASPMSGKALALFFL
jgi:hypothetical protein